MSSSPTHKRSPQSGRRGKRGGPGRFGTGRGGYNGGGYSDEYSDDEYNAGGAYRGGTYRVHGGNFTETENSSLKAQVTKLKNELKQCNRKIDSLQKKNQSLQNSKQAKQLKELKSELSTLKTQLKHYAKENAELSTMKTQLKHYTKENAEFQKAKQSLKKQLRASGITNEQLQKECESFKKQISELVEGETYKRNKILLYNSKNKQSIKPRNNIGHEQETLHEFLKTHDINMTDWMIFTEKMTKQYQECKINIKNKRNEKEINPTIILSTYIECKSLWQQQQNTLDDIADIGKKLAGKKRGLQDCVKNHEEKAADKNNHYKQELDNYKKSNEKRIKLENKLKKKLKDLNKCCDAENKLCESRCKLLNEYNTLEIELNEYKTILNHCSELMEKYREFDCVNDITIAEMQTYFENMWIECMKTWYKWTADSIICWIRIIRYLRETGTLVLCGSINLDKILKQMRVGKVDGNSLLNIDKNDLKSVGFEILSDRQRVFNQIQKLISKYPHPTSYEEEGKNNDGDTYEVKIPNEFLCPLSHKIMEYPVVIFDECTYEKSEIEQYLNKYKQSPKTKRKCDDDGGDIWFLPNRKLKQKIDAFLSVNPQFRIHH